MTIVSLISVVKVNYSMYRAVALNILPSLEN